MHLIKHDILAASVSAFLVFCETFGVTVEDLLNTEKILPRLPREHRAAYADALDFLATYMCACEAQTFLFDTAQILEFLRAVDRKLAPGDYEVPFTEMVIQFTAPIPEHEFLSGYYTGGTPDFAVEDDMVLGIVLGFPGDRGNIVNAVAYYKSTSINRTTLDVGGDGTITHHILDNAISAQGLQDKQRIANLAMLCVAYLNSPGIEVERMAFPDKLNRRRAREGKPPLEDYYICKVDKRRYAAVGEGAASGRRVSFRFDVAGHFRRLGDGRMVWVRAHQRGVEHGLYRPKVYRVEGE